MMFCCCHLSPAAWRPANGLDPTRRDATSWPLFTNLNRSLKLRPPLSKKARIFKFHPLNFRNMRH